jgi:hypothetical protein
VKKKLKLRLASERIRQERIYWIASSHGA